MPDAVVRLRRDQAGHECSVALRVDGGRAGDEALRGGDPAAQLRMRAVDAGVDHGDPDRGERRGVEPGVERSDSAPRTTAAGGRGRSGRTTPGGSAAPPRSAPRARPAAPPPGGRRPPGPAIGARSTISVAPRARSSLRDRGAVGRRSDADGEPRLRSRPGLRRGRAQPPRQRPRPSRSFRLSRGNGDRQRRPDLAVRREPVGRGHLRPHRDGEGAVVARVHLGRRQPRTASHRASRAAAPRRHARARRRRPASRHRPRPGAARPAGHRSGRPSSAARAALARRRH